MSWSPKPFAANVPAGAVYVWPSSYHGTMVQRVYTRFVASSATLACFTPPTSGAGSSPQTYFLPPTPARAPCSHSASVGRRPPAQRQNASASYQLTSTTGCFGPCSKPGARQLSPGCVTSRRPSKNGLHPSISAVVRRPVSATNFRNASTVTSVRPIQKPRVSCTGWRGFSSWRSSPQSSPGTHPISKVPGGTKT